MALRLNYEAHPLHFAPATARSEIWRTVLAMFVMVLVWLFFSLLYQQFILGLIDRSPELATEINEGSTPRGMYVVLLSFGLISASVLVVVRALHERPGFSVCGPGGLVVRQFLSVLSLLVVFCVVVALLPPYDMGAPLVPNLAPGRWALLLPISLLAVFLQVSAEEILFRGYLQQQLAARFRSPLMWMVLPSALFALGHYQPGEAGENAWLIVGWALVFGVLMADLTARAGSLGPALAVHFVNNVMALLITSLPDALGGLALFHAPFDMNDAAALRAWLPVDFAMMVCMWLTARLALRR